MPDSDGFSLIPFLWAAFGVAATTVFYSRFYLQWLASEIKRRSVVPAFFWYQSTVGSLMMLVWAFHAQSPLGALSHSLNAIPYTRNLVHIWRENGRLTRRMDWLATSGALIVAMGAAIVVVVVWLREYSLNAETPPDVARTNWIWLGVGVAGQALFAFRLLVQWALTEWHQKSIVPALFWQISVVAAILQLASYTQQREWYFLVGTTATLFIYARNLWFIHFGDQAAVLTEKA